MRVTMVMVTYISVLVGSGDLQYTLPKWEVLKDLFAVFVLSKPRCILIPRHCDIQERLGRLDPDATERRLDLQLEMYCNMCNTDICRYLSLETPAMTDHLSWKTTYFWQKALHFNTHKIKPATKKDHLSWETTFLCPKRCHLSRQVLLYY